MLKNFKVAPFKNITLLNSERPIIELIVKRKLISSIKRYNEMLGIIYKIINLREKDSKKS